MWALGMVMSAWAAGQSADEMRWYALDQNPILELERYIQLHDLGPVEVYACGASTPAQFDGGNGCRAEVFRTKQ